jgi:hypothetical protein
VLQESTFFFKNIVWNWKQIKAIGEGINLKKVWYLMVVLLLAGCAQLDSNGELARQYLLDEKYIITLYKF